MHVYVLLLLWIQISGTEIIHLVVASIQVVVRLELIILMVVSDWEPEHHKLQNMTRQRASAS